MVLLSTTLLAIIITGAIYHARSQNELGLLAVSFNQMADQQIDTIKHLEQKIKEKTEELILTNEHLLLLTDDLQRMTLKDGLTDIANRRAFDQQFEIEWKRSQREHF